MEIQTANQSEMLLAHRLAHPLVTLTANPLVQRLEALSVPKLADLSVILKHAKTISDIFQIIQIQIVECFEFF